MKKYKVNGIPQAKRGRKLDIEGAKKNPLWENVSASIRKAARKFDLDENLLTRQLLTENEGLSLSAESDAGAMGLPQFMPGTARQYGLTPEILASSKPEDIDKSILAMGQYMSDLKKQYKGSMQDALTAYNWGPGNLDKFKKGKKKAIPEETQNYLETILGGNKFSWAPGEGIRPENVPVHPSDYEEDPFQLDEVTFSAPRVPLRIPTHLGINNETEVPPMGGYPTPVPVDPNTLAPTVPTPNSFNQGLDEEDKEFKSAADNNKVGLKDLLGELYALGDRPDYVQGFNYQPELLQPHRVSFQDMLNQTNSSFRSATARMVNNPDALGNIFAQKLEADNAIMAEQFRTNQALDSDVYNKNVGILNDASLKNIALRDQQFQRQAQAKANTDTRKLMALTSIGNKYAKKQSENAAIRLQENLFNYRPDDKLNMNYTGDPFFVSQYPMATPLSNPYTSTKVRTDPDGDQTTTQMTPAQIDQMMKELQKRQAQAKSIFGKWGTYINKMK